MPKLLSLILAVPLLATAVLPPAIANEPLIVPGPCWMEDEQGRILDLVNLCGGYGTSSDATGSGRAESRSSALDFDGSISVSGTSAPSPRRVVSTVEGMDGFWVELVRASENGAGRSGDVVGRIERPSRGSASGGSSRGGSAGSSGGGNCDTPGDVDSIGRSCGGRSAQSRPGGRP